MTTPSRGSRAYSATVPILATGLGLALLFANALWMKRSQVHDFALPNDKSAASLLKFMREMDGKAELGARFWESSNIAPVSRAVVRAYRELEKSHTRLSTKERREAEYYFLYYSMTQQFTTSDDHARTSVNEIMENSIRFIESAPVLGGQETAIIDGMIATLEQTGEFSREAEFISVAARKLSTFQDSLDAQQQRSKLQSIQRRLGLPSKQIRIQSRTLAQEDFDLEDLLGKVVLIEFYSPHCGPCIEDLPATRRIYQKYEQDGFEIVGICLNTPAARITRFAQEHDLPWVQLCHDITASKDCNKALSEQFGVQIIPTTILVSRTGAVVALGARPLAETPKQDLEALVAKHLAGR